MNQFQFWLTINYRDKHALTQQTNPVNKNKWR
jgi:hypothetical protein